MKNLIKKMIVKPSTPMFAWIKFGTLLVLPSLMYLYGWWIFFMVIIALVLLFIFFPEKWIKTSNTGFMYHAMNGLTAELDHNVEFITPTFNNLFDKRWKKILYWLIFVIHMMMSLGLFSSKHLIIGSLFYYPSMLVIFRLLVEYRDVSLKTSMNSTVPIIDDHLENFDE